MDSVNDFNSEARGYIDVLAATLPQLQFHAYVAVAGTGAPHSLHLFAFITSEVLIGGFTLGIDEEETMFPGRIVSLTQFFRRAWEEEITRFYPPELQTLYEAHLNSGTVLQRVA